MQKPDWSVDFEDIEGSITKMKDWIRNGRNVSNQTLYQYDRAMRRVLDMKSPLTMTKIADFMDKRGTATVTSYMSILRHWLEANGHAEARKELDLLVGYNANPMKSRAYRKAIA